MRALLQKNIGTPVAVIDGVSMLVVMNDDGDPLAAMWTRPDGTQALTRAGEADFEKLLNEVGFGKRVKARVVRV